LRTPPRGLRGPIASPIGTDGQLAELAKALVVSLATEPSVLPIQGPPGSGKTFTGSRMIAELVRQGRRVGITAVSHKVISNLLGETCRHARELGIPLRAVQKSNDRDQCPEASVTQLDEIAAIVNCLRK